MSGDYTVADTLYFMFTTRKFSTGAPFALAAGVISAYENEGLTQITAGVSLGADHDGVTGLNLITVVATGANGFEAGKDYHLVITTGTVDSVSVVGEVVGRFTLSRSAAAVDLANGTDGLGAIKADTAAVLVDTGTTLDGRIPAALTAGGNMKADALAISGSTESADRLERSTLAIVTGTCAALGSTVAVIASALSPASIVNDQFNGRIITFDKDTTTTALRGQATDITDYVHATLTFTVTALTTAPVSGDTFTIT